MLESPNHGLLTSPRPTAQARIQMLQESQNQFQKSDESAYSIDSIVPSRRSISTSQRDSYASGQSQDSIQYRRLSFERRLFMSKVYMRNSRNLMIKELSKARMSFKGKHIATANDQTVTDWEAIRDRLESDSLLAISNELSINDEPPAESHNYPITRPRLFVENGFIIPTGMTLEEELMWACQRGNDLQVKSLADRGVDLHARSNQGQYSGLEGIHVAAMHGHIKIVETLLGCGAMIDEEDTILKWRPLHVAARSGRRAMVQFLIQNGAQIDAKTFYGIQPIHEASRSGSIETLDALIEAGAAIDCSDRGGCQPLHYAAKMPQGSHVIRYLLREGGDIEAETTDGSRPLRLACMSDPTNFRTLIALGAKVDYNNGSESVLQTAISLEANWAVGILLLHGADPNRQDGDGKTALHHLARIENPTWKSRNICGLLLENCANVNIADNAGDRVLHNLATLFPYPTIDLCVIEDLATLVLHKGAEVDARNRNGLTPLYLAMQRDNCPLSKLLLRSGARELKRTDAVRADVQVTTLLDSQTPRYTVNIWRGLNDSEPRWGLSTQSFELSIGDQGYFDMVCEALGDERFGTRETTATIMNYFGAFDQPSLF